MHDIWYPFKRETHMPLVVFINMFLVVQGFLLNTATQTTFICLMIYASTRFKILHIRLRKFDVIAKKKHAGDVLFTVKELICEHQLLIGFVESLNKRTNYVMLLEFVLNSVSLASVTIQLVVTDTASSIFSAGAIVTLILLQIFILAWSANEITLEGLSVADAISAGKWYEQIEEVNQLFKLMLLKAQKPIGIRVGPFFQMNTRTALMTLKIAYSYLSLMMQKYEV
uniref:Odorant receptor 10 n=1 Tax=Eucryptorrhynchus brandti TaxID=436910 RepID=A0A8F4MZH2_EUCBR|nr:odorant receptor 10 [Eucryptorrhynchus brandti]